MRLPIKQARGVFALAAPSIAAEGRHAWPARAREAPAAAVVSQPSPGLTALLLVCVLALGGALRLLVGNGHSINGDEGLSLRYASFPLTTAAGDTTHLTLFQIMATNVHPPLYFVMLHAWVSRFGADVAGARLLSELAGLLCLPLLFVLAAMLYDRTVALFATLVAACSPFLIWHAQEIRMYSFLLLFTLISTYGVYVALERGKDWGWLLAVVGTALAIYTHYLAFSVLGAQALFVACYWRRYARRQHIMCVLAIVVVALAYVPWLVEAARYYTGEANPVFAGANAYTPVAMLTTFILGYQPVSVLAPVVATWPFVVLLALMRLQYSGRPSPKLAFMLCHALVPVVVVIVISATGHSLYIERYLTVSTPALYILLGVAFSGVRHTLVRLAVLAATTSLLLLSWHSQESAPTNPMLQDYAAAVRYIEAHARVGDVVALDSWLNNENAYMEYARTNLPVYPFAELRNRTTFTAYKQTRMLFSLLPYGYLRNRGQDFQAFSCGQRRLWMVYYLEEDSDPTDKVRRFLSTYTVRHQVIIGSEWPRFRKNAPDSYRNIQLVLYTLRPCRPDAQQVRPLNTAELRAIRRLSPTLRDPLASPFGRPGTSATLLGPVAPWPAPGRVWHMPALASASPAPHLLLYNPGPVDVLVKVNCRVAQDPSCRRVTIPFLRNVDVDLTTWGPGYAARALTLVGSGPFAVARMVTTSTDQRWTYAEQGPGTPGVVDYYDPALSYICCGPLNTAHYFGGGAALPGMRPHILFYNRGDTVAHALITLYFAQGRPSRFTFTVPAFAQAAVDLTSLAGDRGAFGARVVADQPSLARLEVGRAGEQQAAMSGETASSAAWHGTVFTFGPGGQSSFVLINPGPRLAHVRLLLGAQAAGQAPAPSVDAIDLPPHAVRTVTVPGIRQTVRWQALAGDVPIVALHIPAEVAEAYRFTSGQ